MTQLAGNLGLFDLIVIAIYFASMLAIGWWCSDRQTSTDEYFVAGRGVGSLMAGISIIATLLSTISYLSTPGEIIRNGPGYLLATLGSPIAFVVVGYLVIPRIMKHDVVSVYQLLQERFGYHVRQTAASFWLLTTLLWMGFIVYTCSLAVAEVLGASVYLLMCVIGIVTTLYTLSGGIRAVIITDLVQAIVLYGGGVAVILLVMYELPGLAWWPDWTSSLASDLRWPRIKAFSLDPTDRLTIASGLFHGFIFWVMSATSNQITIQRFLTTRDARAARRSFLTTLLASFVIDLLLVLLGIALLGYYLNLPDRLPQLGRSVVEQADRLFPHFIAVEMPTGLKGLMVAALLAAAMSSLSSGINSCATVLMTDFAGVFARGSTDPDKAVRRARVLSLIIGVIATALAFYTMLLPGRNILEQGMRVFFFLVVPVFVVFLLLFFVPSSTAIAAWAAIVTGLTSGVLFTFWKQIVGPFMTTSDFSVFLIMPASITLSIIAALIATLVSGRQPSERPG